MRIAEVLNVPPMWHNEALCANEDPNLWWYENSVGTKIQDDEAYKASLALRICNQCPVRSQCLEEGMRKENLLAGSIWGGMMASERALLLGKADVPDKKRLIQGERLLRIKARGYLAGKRAYS
jgi:hypothetical protein